MEDVQMKPDQYEKRLDWLDEQRRKDSDLINHLERRLGDALESLGKQEKQIKELSSEVTRLSAVASRIQHFDDALGKQRDDFSKKLMDVEHIYSDKLRHFDDLRKKDYEELSKNASEMRMKQNEIDKLKDSIEARKHEEIRISQEQGEIEEKVETLLTKTEENTRSLHTMEEARKLDTKRMADFQSESTELRMKIDTIRGKQDSIEDRLRRSETQIDDIAMSEANRRELITMWEEKQELKLVGFEKQWKEWKAAFDEFHEKAVELDEKILKYDENYRALTKARSELDKLIDKLERRITEISEMQRLSEERLKQEWTNFQADQQKGWNTYKLTNDEMWRDHSRTHDKMVEELQVIDEKLSEGLEALEDLSEKSRSRVMDLLNTFKVWADELEERISEIR
jgi:chromosome segregation ATPase